MAIQQITYSDKVDLNTTSVADINKVNASDMNSIKSVVNNNASELGRIGVTLWEGSFSTGTLNVPGISDYSIIIIYVGGLAMLGNQSYGGSVFRTYRSTSLNSYGYRYTYNSTNETIETTTDNPGASDGTNQLTITKIVGVF